MRFSLTDCWAALARAIHPLSRETCPYPELKITRKPESVFGYRVENFEIIGYDPHPAVKAPVAV